MIKENQKYLNMLQVFIDTLTMFISFSIAYWVRFESYFFNLVPAKGYYFLYHQYLPYAFTVVPLYIILYSIFRLYSPMRTHSRRYELINLIKANVTGVIILITALFITNQNFVARLVLFMFLGINVILTFIIRDTIRRILRSSRRNGRNIKHTIIVGFSPAAVAYIDRLKGNPQWGYQIHGIFDDNVASDFEYRGYSWKGKVADLPAYLEENSLDEVVITLSIKEYEKLEATVKTCEKSGVHTKFVPDYYNFISTNPYTEDLIGLPVINIRNVPLTNTVNKFIKRLIDIIGALVAIILFSPVMLITAILVKKSSPGPIIFKQIRVGLGNREFNMYKFRSMGVQAKSKEKTEWTTNNDPRVTPVGKVIRKTSIDELPQLFNVLRGDMSLIGPRPERPFFVEKFKEEIPRYMIKHQVRPGITGWAQINGFRGDTSIRGRIDHDLYYIENWTLSLDIKILFLTFFKGFVNENAY